MSFIDGLVAMLGAMDGDRIVVHEERCISVRNRNAGCLRCADACTTGAIACRGSELAVEPDRCIGCGTCATACPTSAIEVREPSDEELTAEVKRSIVASKGHPVVVCESALRAARMAEGRGGRAAGMVGNRSCRAVEPHALPDVAQIVEVPCLGRIDESLLAGIAAYRAFDVTLVCGACETCAHKPGKAMALSVVQSARNLLGAFGSNMPIEVTEALPAHVLLDDAGGTAYSHDAASPGVSRRDFLRAAKDGSARAASAAVAQEMGARLDGGDAVVPAAYRKVGPDGTLTHFVPSRRVRLYNYLKHVGEPSAQAVDSRIIGAVSIDAERCSSCRMCAVFCPTGAIRKLDGGDTFGIIHRPSACVQCRLCESICPKDAIAVKSLVPIKQFLGREAVCLAMRRPSWEPNRPSSAYDKVHSLLGDNLEMCMF